MTYKYISHSYTYADIFLNISILTFNINKVMRVIFYIIDSWMTENKVFIKFQVLMSKIFRVIEIRKKFNVKFDFIILLDKNIKVMNGMLWSYRKTRFIFGKCTENWQIWIILKRLQLITLFLSNIKWHYCDILSYAISTYNTSVTLIIRHITPNI
jgi:hypothetical protein